MGKTELIAVLVTLADTCNYSSNAHFPINAIRNKVKPRELQNDFEKYLKKLRKKGFAQIKPTRGGETWTITTRGLQEITKGFPTLNEL